MSIILQETFSFASLLLLLVISVTFILWKRGRTYYLAWKLPGINGYPIVGCVPYLLNSNKIMENVTYLFGTKNFGRIWLGPIPIVGISKPEHLQTILNSPYCLARDPLTYRKDDGLFEKGLTAVDPKTWKLHRKLLNPTFGQIVINSYFDIFQERSKSLLEHLQTHVGKGEFNILDPMQRSSLDIICETTMGFKSNNLTEDSKLVNTVTRIGELIAERMVRFWLIPGLFWKISSRGREFKQLIDEVYQNIKPIIKAKQCEYNDRKEKLMMGGIVDGNNGSSEKKLLIDVLFEAENENKYDSTEILQELITFIAAGAETMAISTSHCLLALAMNPEIQEKVVAELEEVFGKTDRPITLDDLPKLTYLERTYKESLRCYTPIPMVPREVGEEIVLDEYILPKYAMALLCYQQLHRDPNIWPNPHVFNPDRFTPEECSKRHPYSFLPFSGGPRNCIGIRYASALSKVYLVSVLRKFKVTTSLKQENIKFVHKVGLHLIGGCQLSLNNRYK